MANYRITPAEWDGPHGTGWIQADAGAGRWSRRQRADSIRAQQGIQPARPVQSPLNGNEAEAFANEWARDNAPYRSVARSMLEGGVLGAVLAYTVQRRRSGR